MQLVKSMKKPRRALISRPKPLLLLLKHARPTPNQNKLNSPSESKPSQSWHSQLSKIHYIEIMFFLNISCDNGLHRTSMPVGGAAAWWAVRIWSPWHGWWRGTGHAPERLQRLRWSEHLIHHDVSRPFDVVWCCHVFKHWVYWVLIVHYVKKRQTNNVWRKNSRPHPSPQTAPHDQQADPVSLCGASPAQSPQPCTVRAVTWLHHKKNETHTSKWFVNIKKNASGSFQTVSAPNGFRKTNCKSCSTQAPQARICCPGWFTVLTARALCAGCAGATQCSSVLTKFWGSFTIKLFISYLSHCIQVVPGQAGGGSFKVETPAYRAGQRLCL